MKFDTRLPGLALGAGLLLGLAGCNSGSPGNQEPATLTIKGRVVDSPIANAPVTVRVGGLNFTGTADADGYFTIALSIPGDATGAFVSITATGSSAQPAVSLASLLGSFAALQTEAGSDGVLEAGENFRVVVSNRSSAEAVLAREANGGALPGSDTTLDGALRQIDQDQLEQLATLVKLVIDYGMPLPGGVTDTQQLIGDPATRASFYADASSAAHAAQYSAALEATRTDPALTPSLSATEVPPALYLTVAGSSLPDLRYYQALSEGFAFNADGTGRYTSWMVDSGAMTWTIDDHGGIAIGFSTPAVSAPYQSYVADPANGNLIQITCSEETRNLSIHRTGATSAVRTISYATSCDDSRFDSSYTLAEARYWLPPSGALPYTKKEVAGRSFTIAVDSSDVAGAEAERPEIAQFNGDGTGSLQPSGRSFSWSVDAEGTLLATLPSGASSRYTRVAKPFEKGEIAVAELQRADGSRRLIDNFGYESDGSLDFSVVKLPAVYYAVGVGDIDYDSQGQPFESPLRKGQALQLDTDGRLSTRNDYVTTDPDSGVQTRVVDDANRSDLWGVRSDGTLVQQEYVDASSYEPAPFCEFDSTDPSCFLALEREVTPLSVGTLNRKFWYEVRRYADEGPVTSATPTNVIARFWDYAPLGDYELPRQASAAPAAVKVRPLSAASSANISRSRLIARPDPSGPGRRVSAASSTRPQLNR